MTGMNTLSRVPIAALLVMCGATAEAADAPARPPAAAPAAAASPVRIEPSSPDPREPLDVRTVIDDGRAVIEELRVRGQLVKATVHPKDGSPSYEIIVGDGSRELSTEGRNNSRGATGKRVWQVLSF